MTRDGRVVWHRIERSSGYASLDEQVDAMMRRGDSLPAPPPEWMPDEAEISLRVSLAFTLTR